MSEPRPLPRPLLQLTLGYVVVWIGVALAQLAGLAPLWLSAGIAFVSLPLGIVWLRWAREAAAPRMALAVVASLLYPVWWHSALIGADVFGLPGIRGSLAATGAFGLFFLGLGWIVWALENVSRRLELARIDEEFARPSQSRAKRTWNPLDPAAWYYGRKSPKLKQSTLVVVSYAAAFWLVTLLISQMHGCSQVYELPAGGGKQKTVAQTVRIQKIIRKKFVVNPFSAIKFEVPPIDEVKLKLQEVTAHQYTIGYGEGTGAGFAGGTSKGKIRLIRLEYDGGDWDLNFGIGGDANMLMEYGILTQQRVAEKTESIRISQLASFPREKSPPVVFLTGQKSLSVSNNEIKTLREYLRDKHGLLFASSGSAHFHNQFMALMSRVLPDIRPVPVPLDDTIHRVPFAVPLLPYVVPHGGREALGWSADGRWLAYYHPGDISDAWADGHAGVSREVYDGCYQLGANVINYGHVEYSKWLQAKGPGK